MRVLIIKTSSLGDVIHTLPALTDAGNALPGIQFDWVVEENFAEIPRWHPLVDQIFPIAIRRWRKNLFSDQTREEFSQFRKLLSAKKYDLIIDAQGLLKSAWITRLAKGVRCGFDSKSARESLAALFYQRRFAVAKGQHAINRVRHLFSQALGYTLPTSVPDYGVDRTQLASQQDENYLLFFHGTTWATKHWPETYWVQLANLANEKGFLVKLPWGNAEEQSRAQRIAADCSNVEVLPRLNLTQMTSVLAGAKASVAVDTGFGHIAAALNVPTVSLYGPTNAVLTGALGQSQVHLSAQFPCAPCLSRVCTYRAKPSPNQPNSPLYPLQPPCFATLLPGDVWNALATLF